MGVRSVSQTVNLHVIRCMCRNTRRIGKASVSIVTAGLVWMTERIGLMEFITKNSKHLVLKLPHISPYRFVVL